MSSKRKASDVEDEGETEEVVKVAKVESNGEKSEDEEKDAGENGVSAEAGASAPAANQKSEDKEVPAPSVAVAADIPDKDKGKVKGPDHAGTLLICGGTNWDLSGRKSLPKGGKNQGPNLWTPHRFKPMSGIRVRLVASGCVAAHSIIVTEEGRAFSFGRYEKGQLGVGDQVRRDNPTLIEAIKDEFIVGASCGRNHSLMLTDRGEVYAAGDNKMGQCGIKNASQASADVATAVNYKGAPIVKVDCGGDFSIILDCKGAMHSFGLPEYGQLGHNTDGKFFVTSTKMGFDYQTAPKRIVFFIERGKDGKIKPVEVDEIRDFSCGTNHTVAIDARKRAFSWGFGGLGRLGHAEQRDEMMPRLIKFFDSQNRGVKAVFCGNSYSLAINDFGVVFMFGQNKRTGEANMYPKPNQDLTGWNVRSVGCSTTSIVVAADESVIAWGPSPTSGELGFGEARKSSTVPMEVKPLDGMYIEQVTCGVSHTLFIARDITEEEKEKINALPEYAPA